MNHPYLKGFLLIVFFALLTLSSQAQQEHSSDDNKYASSRTLEIRYQPISDTSKDHIMVGEKQYKWYSSKEEAIREFENALIKHDLLVVYVNERKDDLQENPEYFEIKD